MIEGTAAALALLLGCGVYGSEERPPSGIDAGPTTDADAGDASTADVDVPETGQGIDAGPVSGGCNGRLDCERVVFVTSAGYVGQLGGTSGADAKCQLAASGSPLSRIAGRRFQAWISAETAAVVRLPHGTGGYVLPDGAIVARTWNDLIDGHLAEPIDRDERGRFTFGEEVWTGTLPGGAQAEWHCSAFGSLASKGAFGVSTARDLTWTWTDVGADCNLPRRLYCFEY